MTKESPFARISARTPESTKIFVAKALDLVEQVDAVLAEKGLSQRDLAKRLGKGDSEVSKWLSGTHNMTLESIAKLEAALQADLMVTRLNPDGYFNRRQLTRLEVAKEGGAHKLTPKKAEADMAAESGKVDFSAIKHIGFSGGGAAAPSSKAVDLRRPVAIANTVELPLPILA